MTDWTKFEADLTRAGRAELVARIIELVDVGRRLERVAFDAAVRVGEARADFDAVYEHRGQVQARCTELLDEARGLRALVACGILADVAKARWAAEMKHGKATLSRRPDGTGGSGMPGLLKAARALAEHPRAGWADLLYEEVLEAAVETEPAKLRAELIDVIVVAIRWVSNLDARPA